MSQSFANQDLLVIKVGTHGVTRAGAIDRPAIDQLVDEIAGLMKSGKPVVLVSSGAVGAGMAVVGELAAEVGEVARRQVYSAAGQIELMQVYRESFTRHKRHCAQVLASRSDFRDRNHYLNMQRCLGALLDQGMVPIVNENDVVSVTELMFTDNDELAGLLAAMLDARALFLLSDIDGIYQPKNSARVIREWDDRHAASIGISAAAASALGRGGIQSKLKVARRVANLGIETWVANARRPKVVDDLLQGKGMGTHFRASRRATPVKRWVAASDGHEKGRVQINPGAVAALRDPSSLTSLLPIGITAIRGDFEKGDILRIESEDGDLVALGKAGCGSESARKSIGLRGRRPLVHYDYLYIEKDLGTK
jgi:glutamate 5-kinase